MIQLEQGINQGTSGGPLIDIETNEVIGIVSFEIAEKDGNGTGGAVKAFHVFDHPQSSITRNRIPD